MNNDELGQLITRIKKDVLKVGDEIYGAVTKKTPKNNLTDLLYRSHNLLKEYDDLLSQLKGGKKESLLSFEFDVDQIRENLKIIEAN
ncbi:MAG: hypothetical protein JW982_16795 [Spirochaetes bacterium]|nr:hypothetical protein [Spirochaetota bacterium]